MLYDVRFATSSIEKKFNKYLLKIPGETQRKIIQDVKNLAQNPRPFAFKKIKPPIELFQFVAQYRIRIGDYRVLYDIDDTQRIVWIFAARKRDEGTYKH